MGKVAEEAMWAQLVRWEADLSISSLRFTNVVAPGDSGTFARA
ncbi:UNVERIFIED_ORG: nucleoside-diphosphate-sugar epimerase [Arthrobacter sp. UYCu721]